MPLVALCRRYRVNRASVIATGTRSGANRVAASTANSIINAAGTVGRPDTVWVAMIAWSCVVRTSGRCLPSWSVTDLRGWATAGVIQADRVAVSSTGATTFAFVP